MCRATFTENVINLAMENCFMCDIPDILTPAMVYKMSPERLEELGSEKEDVQAERKVLQDQIQILEAALAKCRRSRPRDAKGISISSFVHQLPITLIIS